MFFHFQNFRRQDATRESMTGDDSPPSSVCRYIRAYVPTHTINRSVLNSDEPKLGYLMPDHMIFFWFVSIFNVHSSEIMTPSDSTVFEKSSARSFRQYLIMFKYRKSGFRSELLEIIWDNGRFRLYSTMIMRKIIKSNLMPSDMKFPWFHMALSYQSSGTLNVTRVHDWRYHIL